MLARQMRGQLYVIIDVSGCGLIAQSTLHVWRTLRQASPARAPAVRSHQPPRGAVLGDSTPILSTWSALVGLQRGHSGRAFRWCAGSALRRSAIGRTNQGGVAKSPAVAVSSGMNEGPGWM